MACADGWYGRCTDVVIGPGSDPGCGPVPLSAVKPDVRLGKCSTRGTHPPDKLYKPVDNNVLPSTLCTAINSHAQAVGEKCFLQWTYVNESLVQLAMVMVSDYSLMHLANTSHVPRLVFGCAYHIENKSPYSSYPPYYSPPQGILGLGKSKGSIISSQLSDILYPPPPQGVLGLGKRKESIPSQLSAMNLTQNVIGHCLKTQGGGFLFLGADNIPENGMTWTPMLFNSNGRHDGAGPAKLLFGGNPTGIEHLFVIFDTAYTYTYLHPQVYDTILDKIRNNVRRTRLQDVKNEGFSVCWRDTKPIKVVQDVRNYFSTLSLSFPGDVQLQLPPEAYLIATEQGNICLGIKSDKYGNRPEQETNNVIGESLIQSKIELRSPSSMGSQTLLKPIGRTEIVLSRNCMPNTRSSGTKDLVFNSEPGRTLFTLRRENLTREQGGDSSTPSSQSNSPRSITSSSSLESQPSRENMGKENNNRTLRELAAPNVATQRLAIQYPTNEENFEIKSGFIQLLPKFHGMPGEDPHRHLTDFQIVCSSMKMQGHHTDRCPSLVEDNVEEVNALGMQEGFRRKQEPFPRSYNSYGNQGAYQVWPNNYPRQSSHYSEGMQQMKETMEIIKKQIGQLSSDVSELKAQSQNKIPSQPKVPPKENVNAITLRSVKELEEPYPTKPTMDEGTSKDEEELHVLVKEIKIEDDEPIILESVKDNGKAKEASTVKPKLDSKKEPFPTKLKRSTKEDDDQDILDIFRKVEVNIPLLDAIQQVPRYAKLLKQLCTSKKRLQGKLNVGAIVSAVLQKHLPPKCKDPGMFSITCSIGNNIIENAMLDLGASLSVMPYSFYQTLNVGPLKYTDVVFQLADGSLVHPKVEKWVKKELGETSSTMTREQISKGRQRIASFRQRKDENFYLAWERFKKLCADCPQHGIPQQILITYFYQGLGVDDQILVDSINDIPLFDRTCEDAYEALQALAQAITPPSWTKKSLEKEAKFPTTRRLGITFASGWYYYPDLVKQFYANINKDREGYEYTITTMVKGKDIVVDEEYLCQMLGLNNEGSMFYFIYVDGEQRTATESTWKRDGALRRFDIPLGMDNQGNREVKVKYMEPRDRLVCYLLHHNVIHRSSNKHKFRIEDFYVVDKLCHGLGRCGGIPMAKLLLSRIWEVVNSTYDYKTFVFPLLISKILINEGVEVDGELHFNNEGNVINVSCLSHLGVKRRVIANSAHWCNVHRRTYEQGLEQPHVEGQPPLEVNEENFQELPMR
ncbi:Peptidase A1 [Corchorus capsularis]|uniref:Peptidase A1 n=1 Tax=Corchorus capsularis TaxID=210143 RepID=A0A1R3GCB9_COCAP|nr:Peptidase A1 [Corchorus capsularis]